MRATLRSNAGSRPGAHASAACRFAIALLSTLALAHTATAAERELEQAPPPSSANEIETPLERAFLRPARKRPLFGKISEALDKLPPFFAETQLDARFRTFYLRKDRTIDILSEAWAVGGSLYYASGWLADLFSVEAELFTSQPAVAPEGKGGTLLLAPVQNGYTVLGIGNGKLRHRGVTLTGYRQYLGLPYVNRNDSRMTPNTFEAVTLEKDEGTVRFSTGYIWNIKRRNSDEFVSMAEAAGVQRERGLAYAGVLYQPDKSFHVGASGGIVPDLYAAAYTEAGYTRALTPSLDLRLDGQFTYQQSVGQELLISPPFETWNFGLRAATSWEGVVFRLGFSLTGNDRGIFSPYGSNPSYVDLMQRSFTQADEKALLVSLSYDFAGIGARGLTTIVNFVEGWDGRILGIRGGAREVDVTMDYRVPESLRLFDGFWFRVRGSWLHDDRTARDGTDIRVILRYDFPVL